MRHFFASFYLIRLTESYIGNLNFRLAINCQRQTSTELLEITKFLLYNQKMEKFQFKIISQKIIKNPRTKVLGIFLMILGFFVIEIILRDLSHSLANWILSPFTRNEIFTPGILINKIFSKGAPLILIGIPITVYLWIMIRDGLQKFDWWFAPLLIGIVLKNGVYGILSLTQKSGEFWDLTTLYVPPQLLWIFILLFLFTGLAGFFIWFKEIS
jgi:hypothetical protein